MECEDQEQELEYGDGEIEWDMENGDEPPEPGSHDDASGSPDTKKPFSIPDISADIAKGKAAKQQIELWEKLLEVCIYLQKMLTISNRLPSHEVCPEFVEHGKQPATDSVAYVEKQLRELMNKLVIVQNPDTERIVPKSTATSSHKQQEGIDDEYLSKMQHSLKDHCDLVITKWQDRTHLASGLVISNKEFMKFNRSVVTQINRVMEDTPRLVKRSQYKILGKTPESLDLSHDVHLRDYEEEIFYDDDFYRQLLQALINGKMKLTDTSDPVAMGRQLLELQKMRRRAKKTVDTRASKGRKIR
ncbi:protein AATF-like isoform X2 [Dysidea avara]